jgi:hypothetical protein
MSEQASLPEATNELELRAKKMMTEDGYRHWMTCRAERKCCACGKPLGDKVERDCHPSCRVLTYKYATDGHWTIGSRIRDGKIGPPSRPTNPLTLEARQLSGEQDE